MTDQALPPKEDQMDVSFKLTDSDRVKKSLESIHLLMNEGWLIGSAELLNADNEEETEISLSLKRKKKEQV